MKRKADLIKVKPFRTQNITDIKKPEHLNNKGYSGFYRFSLNLYLVQMERLELSRPKAPPPQGGASTNSATSANFLLSQECRYRLLF